MKYLLVCVIKLKLYKNHEIKLGSSSKSAPAISIIKSLRPEKSPGAVGLSHLATKSTINNS